MIDSFKEMIALMKEHSVPPCVVKTDEEAKSLTQNDPFGHEWKVGDEYYRVETLRESIRVLQDEVKEEMYNRLDREYSEAWDRGDYDT